MKIVVIGATGNIGTSVVAALARESTVREVVGIARRVPGFRISFPKTTFASADVATDPLAPFLKGADAVVHLAWALQPARDPRALYAVNVTGSRRVFEAAAEAGVRLLVYGSSAGAYSPAPGPVDENHPTGGVATSLYSRHKAEVERLLDAFEADSHVRVVRMRPALSFKREAGQEIRRYFLGPLFPSRIASPGRIPVLPLPRGLHFQAVHSDDVAEAYRRALLSNVSGAFNLAAGPVLDPAVLARHLDARHVAVPAGTLRALLAATYRLHLQPSEPGWLDLGLHNPLVSTDRARSELGWEPSRSSLDALDELLAGIRERAGLPTPPLRPGAGGVLRWREFAGRPGR